jgi:hypothetical protein
MLSLGLLAKHIPRDSLQHSIGLRNPFVLFCCQSTSDTITEVPDLELVPFSLFTLLYFLFHCPAIHVFLFSSLPDSNSTDNNPIVYWRLCKFQDFVMFEADWDTGIYQK